MLTGGLVSISFRKLTKEQIGALMAECGLTAVEWGGDIHVPSDSPQDIANACAICKQHGIQIAAYGSYFRPWEPTEASRIHIRQEIGCARALGAKTIRIWAGRKGSKDITPAERTSVVTELQDACDAAYASGLTVSLECHNGTLTDDCDSALQLVEEVRRDNLKLYWQPNQFRDDAYNLRTLERELPYITNVHVFAWEGSAKYPLVQQEEKWKRYIEILRSTGRDHNLLLEFMYNDQPEQLKIDGPLLLEWIQAK